MAVTFAILAVLLFAPAHTFRFWQAWLYLGLQGGSWTYFFFGVLKHDPQLAERRMQSKEPERVQKIILKIFSWLLFIGFVLAGLDFRFGWSRAWLGGVPTPVVLAAQLVVVAGYCLVYWVMKTNTFAASTIQVEAEHRVIDTGPYASVRHPMYSGMIITSFATPLALGSYVALLAFALILPILIFRLIHEERTLRRDLPGYSEYCDRTRFRLIPAVW